MPKYLFLVVAIGTKSKFWYCNGTAISQDELENIALQFTLKPFIKEASHLLDTILNILRNYILHKTYCVVIEIDHCSIPKSNLLYSKKKNSESACSNKSDIWTKRQLNFVQDCFIDSIGISKQKYCCRMTSSKAYCYY